jgi:hypothetical protein
VWFFVERLDPVVCNLNGPGFGGDLILMPSLGNMILRTRARGELCGESRCEAARLRGYEALPIHCYE